MNDGPKVLSFDGKDDFAASISSLKRNLPNLLEHGRLVAFIKRNYFQALVAEGFTPAEALELAKHSTTI